MNTLSCNNESTVQNVEQNILDETKRFSDINQDPIIKVFVDNVSPIPVTTQQQNSPSHLLTYDTAREYIKNWNKYNEDIKTITKVSIKKIANASLLGPLFNDYYNALLNINKTMLINFEKFNINSQPPTANSAILNKLMTKSENLEIHIGIKPLSSKIKSNWNTYDQKQWKKMNKTKEWDETKTAWHDKTQIQCVILIGKDNKGNIETIEIN